MSMRIKALTVALTEDLREEDAQALLAAIRQLKGVADVTGVEVDTADWTARAQVRAQLAEALQRAFFAITIGQKIRVET